MPGVPAQVLEAHEAAKEQQARANAETTPITPATPAVSEPAVRQEETAIQHPPGTVVDLYGNPLNVQPRQQQPTAPDAAEVQRQRVEEGRVKKLAQELAAAQKRAAELEMKLAAREEVMALLRDSRGEAEKKPGTNGDAADRFGVTQAEVEQFGQEDFGLIERVVQKAVGESDAKWQERLRTLEAQQQEARDAAEAQRWDGAIRQHHPQFWDIAATPEFMEFQQNVDPISGKPYAAILAEAQKANNPGPVIGVFNLYSQYRNQGMAQQPAQGQPRPYTVPPKIAGTGNRSAGVSEMIPMSQIRQFQKDYVEAPQGRGPYAGPEGMAKARALLVRINQAELEGRIIQD